LKLAIFHNFRTFFTLDWVIRHSVVYQSSTSTYIQNFVEIEKLFGKKTVQTDGHWDWLYRVDSRRRPKHGRN